MKLATYLTPEEWSTYSASGVYNNQTNIRFLNSYLLKELVKVLRFNTGVCNRVLAFAPASFDDNRILEILEKSSDCHKIELDYDDDLCSFFRKSDLMSLSQILDKIDTKYYDIFMEDLYESREPISFDDTIIIVPLLESQSTKSKTRKMEVTDK